MAAPKKMKTSPIPKIAGPATARRVPPGGTLGPASAKYPGYRPQLDKMGPGQNTMRSGRRYNGILLADASPDWADRRNASYVSARNNVANKAKEIAAITSASKGGKLRKGGK